jgi:hypothetical protein
MTGTRRSLGCDHIVVMRDGVPLSVRDGDRAPLTTQSYFSTLLLEQGFLEHSDDAADPPLGQQHPDHQL